jgi:adenylate kinase family enzyme
MTEDRELACLRRARRILVLGSPGSGKTQLSAILSPHLGLELLHLDDFFWKPGPVRTPQAEWRALVAELASRPSWIMDGTYEASLDLRIPAAEAIIFIESNRWACLWRVFVRRLRSRWRSDPERAYVQAMTPFFVRYVYRFPRSTRPEVFRSIAVHGPHNPLIVLRGTNGVDRFIRRLERGSRHAAAPEDGALAERAPVRPWERYRS